MKILLITCAAISAVSGGAAHSQTPLIGSGATWKYLDDGSDQGTAWRAPAFDDSLWSEGPAELGYGDGGEATVVGYGGDPANKFITTYFRRSFDVPDPSQYPALQLDALYDDGCIVFLNGVEVARFNMPGTPGQNDFDYGTFASSTIEETWSVSPVDPALLVAGSNTVAVEIHQCSVTSSDISFNLSLGPPLAPMLRKGPYLIYRGVNTEMQVLWQLGDTETNLLEWGRDTSYADGSAQTLEYGTDHQHEFNIGNLLHGDKYFYRVTDANSVTYTGSFLAPPRDSATKLKFFGYGDTRTYPADHDAVCSGIVQEYQADPALQTFLLHDGDWSEFDTEAAWDTQYFSVVSLNARQVQSELSINGCRGNHEAAGTVFSKYWPYPDVSDFYWSYDYGPVHVSVADSYVAFDPASAQYQWLENDLRTTSKRWKFLVIHEPGWSAGGGHPNNVDVQNYLQPLCVTYGVSVVFCGHNHYYARCDVSGVQHITSGGAGAPLHTCDFTYPNIVTCSSVHHYCVFEIDDDTLAGRAIDTNGNEVDFFTLTSPTDLDLGAQAVVTDSCVYGGPGNLNGAAEPGEDVTLDVTLVNRGTERASKIVATLSSTTPGVTILAGRETAAYPDLDPAGSATGITSFAFSTDPSVVHCGDALNFLVEFTYTTALGDRIESDSFAIGVPTPCSICAPPDLSVESVGVVTDSCSTGGGNGNSLVEPGEHAVVRVRLSNRGPVAATSITATLSSADVTVTQGAAALAVLASSAQGDLAPDFEFDVDPSTLCGTVLDFTLQLTYDQGAGTMAFSIPIPDPCQPCPQTGCRLGVPNRILDFKLTRSGGDIDFTWSLDSKAEGGYDLYMTDIKSDIPDLRLENPPHIPDPFLTAGPAEPMPLVYGGGVNSGLLYYQILGVCFDNATEGPN